MGDFNFPAIDWNENTEPNGNIFVKVKAKLL